MCCRRPLLVCVQGACPCGCDCRPDNTQGTQTSRGQGANVPVAPPEQGYWRLVGLAVVVSTLSLSWLELSSLAGPNQTSSKSPIWTIPPCRGAKPRFAGINAIKCPGTRTGGSLATPAIPNRKATSSGCPWSCAGEHRVRGNKSADVTTRLQAAACRRSFWRSRRNLGIVGVTSTAPAL